MIDGISPAFIEFWILFRVIYITCFEISFIDPLVVTAMATLLSSEAVFDEKAAECGFLLQS